MTRTKRDFPNLADAVKTGSGVERSFRCDSHDDKNASASVNVDKGVWVCFSCGASGRVDAKALTPTLSKVLKLMTTEVVPAPLPEEWLNWFNSTSSSPYWVNRVGETTARKYQTGTHPYTGAPTYPIHDATGNILGVVQRLEGDGLKYLYPVGVSVSHHLFGFHLINDLDPVRKVIVVEGASDVMELAAYCPKDVYVVGCYGAGLHAPQVELLNQLMPAEVVLAFDNDQAGQLAIKREYGLFSLIHLLKYEWPDDVKDAGEASNEMKSELTE